MPPSPIFESKVYGPKRWWRSDADELMAAHAIRRLARNRSRGGEERRIASEPRLPARIRSTISQRYDAASALESTGARARKSLRGKSRYPRHLALLYRARRASVARVLSLPARIRDHLRRTRARRRLLR